MPVVGLSGMPASRLRPWSCGWAIVCALGAGCGVKPGDTSLERPSPDATDDSAVTGPPVTDSPGDGETETETAADTDSDTDTFADTDTDADADADTDTDTDTAPPEPAPTYLSIQSAGTNTCGENADHSLTCWPWGSATGSQFSAYGVGWGGVCGVKTGGIMECWTYLGVQETSPKESYSQSIRGDQFSCGIRTSDSTIECWGSNANHGLEHPEGPFVALTAYETFACALDASGEVDCWGNRDFFDLYITPNPGPFVQIDAGWNHSCGVLATGELSCWGADGAGESSPPVGNNYVKVSAGLGFSCALDVDHHITCWGLNDHGECEPPAGEYMDVAANFFVGCALRLDGTAVCWGDKLAWGIPP